MNEDQNKDVTKDTVTEESPKKTEEVPQHPPHKEDGKKKHHHDKKKDVVKDLEQRMHHLEDALKEAEDKLVREKAESINYRKRKDEEVTRMVKYAGEDMIKELLPIMDSFERAISMDDDNLEDEVSKFLAGFKMIYCNLVTTFEKHGVKEIQALNVEFDPNFHQAVLTEPREGVESGIVIEVLQKGYTYKDKVIRPSMVKVSE